MFLNSLNFQPSHFVKIPAFVASGFHRPVTLVEYQRHWSRLYQNQQEMFRLPDERGLDRNMRIIYGNRAKKGREGEAAQIKKKAAASDTTT